MCQREGDSRGQGEGHLGSATSLGTHSVALPCLLWGFRLSGCEVGGWARQAVEEPS